MRPIASCLGERGWSSAVAGGDAGALLKELPTAIVVSVSRKIASVLFDVPTNPLQRHLVPHDVVEGLKFPEPAFSPQQSVYLVCRRAVPGIENALEFLPRRKPQQRMDVVGHNDVITEPETLTVASGEAISNHRVTSIIRQET